LVNQRIDDVDLIAVAGQESDQREVGQAAQRVRMIVTEHAGDELCHRPDDP
jgi:hypothetical protein